MRNLFAASAAAVGKRKSLVFALLLSSSALIGPAMAMPNGLAAMPQGSRLQEVRWVCGPYRCWWRPGLFYRGGPYWRGYWGPHPYYRHYRW